MKTQYDMNSGSYQEETAEMVRSKHFCYLINQEDPTNETNINGLLSSLFKDRLPTSSKIWVPTQIDRANKIVIGKNVFINLGLTTVALGGINIGDNVQIGPNVTLITANHDIKQMNILNTESIEIGKNAWVGANVTILPGVTIGNDSIVGAGSIVTKNIPAGVIAVGNPAKVIKKIK
ncbi:DapH/DapD/GlmU-related protein [Levilactobacillus acidifarinae]|uniref:DapH/DapD/GlmU-related protein n=1 Tax=Levilactobacillus acidifarinae TaxID=267364 RepID=UPI00070EE740|nr:DapH/DapD/GlmU-related protein [Levilactobacillus acidifarinae]GEO68167.1 maltose O-acetyltransferase [Levilactobacillus acidifarinae]